MSDAPNKKLLSLRSKSADDSAPKIEERLHKVLAQAGLGSRRALEERIAQGLVKVNGEVARTGQSVSSGDRIELDGKTFVATALTEPSSVLIYNKPEGEVTTREDTEGRPTIFDSLPRLKGARWIAVGRLDINTTGLLLLTTDGELANALMHPSNAIEREYVCRIPGEVPDNIVDRLARGVALDDGPAKFDTIERINSSGSHSWFQVMLTEGRNREVRRLWESQGYQVSRLKRVRYGDVTLPRLLKRGHCVAMEPEKVQQLRAQFGLENAEPVLTLQPVIGQRKSRPMEIRVGKDRGAQAGYVNGHVNDEARELRRFDHVREDKPRGRGRPGGAPRGKPGGRGKPFSGPMDHANPDAPRPPFAGKRHGKGGPRDDNFGNRADHGAPRNNASPYAARGPRGAGPSRGGPGGAPQGPRGPRPHGPRPEGGQPGPGGYKSKARPGHDGGEFRSWYVPEGVETGSKVAPPRGPRGHGPSRGGPGGPPQGPRGPRPGGDRPFNDRGPRHDARPGQGPRPQGPRPPQGARPNGPRPQNARPHGPQADGNRGPRGNDAHRGPRHDGNRAPDGNRGPRSSDGNRGPRPPFRKRPDGLPSDD